MRDIRKNFVILTTAKAICASSVLGVLLACRAHSLPNWQVGFTVTERTGSTDMNFHDTISLNQKARLN